MALHIRVRVSAVTSTINQTQEDHMDVLIVGVIIGFCLGILAGVLYMFAMEH